MSYGYGAAAPFGAYHHAGPFLHRPVHHPRAFSHPGMHFDAISSIRNSHSPQKYGVVVEPPAKRQVEMTQGRPMSAAERIRSSNDAFKAEENATQAIEAPPAPSAPFNDAPPPMPALADVPAAQLYDYMQRLFKIGDVDGNDALDALELRNLLSKSGFKFSEQAIQDLMISADTNKDGLIQFDEFCVAIKGLQSGGFSSSVVGAPPMPALADVPAAQLNDYMLRLFKIGDKDGNGVLDSEELTSLLRKSGFNFSDAMISEFMRKADTNHDGVIQYDEFCVAIKQLQKGGFSAASTPPAMPALSDVPAEQLENYLQRLFKIGDKNNDGVLDGVELRNLLQKSGFNLDVQTIADIMVAVDVNKDGVIQYDEFCEAIKGLIQMLPSANLLAKSSSDMPDINVIERAQLESYFQRLFAIGDINNDGVLSPEEFESLLRKSGFNFDDNTIGEIMDSADVNHDGVIEYDEFVPAIMAMVGGKTVRGQPI
jgi:Ca2+-binding EF-hand superfamily protein